MRVSLPRAASRRCRSPSCSDRDVPNPTDVVIEADGVRLGQRAGRRLDVARTGAAGHGRHGAARRARVRTTSEPIVCARTPSCPASSAAPTAASSACPCGASGSGAGSPPTPRRGSPGSAGAASRRTGSAPTARLVANSVFTADWIRRWWSADSHVLYPPVTMRARGQKQPTILSVGPVLRRRAGPLEEAARDGARPSAGWSTPACAAGRSTSSAGARTSVARTSTRSARPPQGYPVRDPRGRHRARSWPTSTPRRRSTGTRRAWARMPTATRAGSSTSG